jgi:zinc protease
MMVAAALMVAPVAHAAIEVETTRVGHGVTAWYARNDAVPVVDVVLSFEGAGYASDPDGKAGRAAFAAAMLGEGAGELSSEAMRQAFEEKAITFEATTDGDRLQIHVYCLREHAVRAGELLALAVTRATLADADQQRIKAQIGSLLARVEESPAYRAERLLLTRGFADHPYANAPYGSVASVHALGAPDVREYLTTHVTRGNLLITAAGDVDSAVLPSH